MSSLCFLILGWGLVGQGRIKRRKQGRMKAKAEQARRSWLRKGKTDWGEGARKGVWYLGLGSGWFVGDGDVVTGTQSRR